MKKEDRPKIEEIICKQIAIGKSLRSICQQKGMPNKLTVLRWAMEQSEDKKAFCNQYARARQMQAELLADEIFDIADDGTNDYMINEKGKTVVDHDNIQRSRLRVDTRKWYLSKVLPKVYGDKLTLAGDVNIGLTDPKTIFPNEESIKAHTAYLIALGAPEEKK